MTTAVPDPHSEAVLSRTAPPPDEIRAYGADPAQVYDLRLPPPASPNGPFVGERVGVPVRSTANGPFAGKVGGAGKAGSVLVIHGGFWRAVHDRSHAAAQAHALALAGYHVAVGEYRRTGMPGGGVPGTLEDLAALVAAVARDPDLPDPLVLLGHSAGGHLVAWAANQGWAERVTATVVLAGCLDLRVADRMRLGDGAAREFVGGPPDRVPEAWRVADPMTSLPPRIPVRLVHGALDREVPRAANDAYLAGCRQHGVDVPLDVVPDAGHYSLIDPAHPAWARTLAAVQVGMSTPRPSGRPGAARSLRSD